MDISMNYREMPERGRRPAGRPQTVYGEMPVRRRRISRQEMLRRKRAARRRRLVARLLRLSVFLMVTITALSLWNSYGAEITPTVRHLYYQLTSQYNLSVSRYDFSDPQISADAATASAAMSDETVSSIEADLADLLEKNPEAADFVACYPDRADYLGKDIDLSDDIVIGQVPLFLQWDKRWGYTPYGDNILGLAGCGPTCLSMAYVYFTHDLNGNPAALAAYSEQNGYYTKEGTSWSLWTEGVQALGLQGEALPLNKKSMQQALDQGGLIVCSMRPGDFTTTGHYILLCGYDESGFQIKDPNRVSNSSRTWDYDVLSSQIKNLWVLHPTGH